MLRLMCSTDRGFIVAEADFLNHDDRRWDLTTFQKSERQRLKRGYRKSLEIAKIHQNS